MAESMPREIAEREPCADSGAAPSVVHVPREQVLAAFATAPALDADRLRADLDAAVEQDLFDPVRRRP